MGGGVTTFRARRGGADPGQLVESLARAGYDIGSSEPVTRTVLDTFDGRLAAAGLRLELTTARPDARRRSAGELVLRGGEGAPARVTVTGVPVRADDIPSGPLRFRLARLLEVRVLIPLVAVSAERTVVTMQNSTLKTTVMAFVYGHPRVGDQPLGDDVIDVVELAGYTKPAVELRELVEAAGWQESPDGLAEIAATATGVDLAGRSVSPGVKLDADLAAIDGFRRVFANLRDAIVVNWDGTAADIDPEFLHDLRVAVRRTRSVLTNAKGVLPADVRDQAKNEFKWFGQLTTPARDLDVYLIEWSDYTDPLGTSAAESLESVRAYLEGQRVAEHTSLTAQLRSGERAAKIIDAWSVWLDEPLAGELPDGATQPIGPLIAKRTRRAHRTMIRRGRTITPDTPGEVLHELRKDAKKLRYLLECFAGLYKSGPRKAFVRRLKDLQDNLGQHQDAEVHVHYLRELSATLAPSSTTDTMLATGQLIGRLEHTRIACRDEFAERFAGFDNGKTSAALDDLLASASDGGSA